MASAAELKEKGTQLYKQNKLTDALKCYAEAAALQPHDPVYHANVTAVLFEMGQYKQCIQGINHALMMLATAPNPQLASRLLHRKSKALFYTNNTDESAKTLVELAELCKKSGIDNPNTNDALVKAVSNLKLGGDYPKLSVFRSASDTRASEYYIIGHDPMFSAFAGDMPMEQTKHIQTSPPEDTIPLRTKYMAEAPRRINLHTSKQDSFSFLFGGIGDARHLFGSLLDIGAAETGNKKFHFTMVDIKPAVIARDLIVFYVLKDLSEVPRKEMHEAVEVITLAYYTYVGALMPNYIHAALLKTIRKLISDLINKTMPTWLFVDEQSIPSILLYLNDWLSDKIDTQVMWNKNNTEKPDLDFIAATTSSSLNLPDELKSRLNADDKLAKTMATWSDEQIMKFPVDGSTIAEKKENIKKLFSDPKMQKILNNEDRTLPGLFHENWIYEKLRVLYPPQALMSRHAIMSELMDVLIKAATTDLGPNDKSPKDALKEAKKHVMKEWKPNPTFWDKWWNEIVTEQHPLTAFPCDAVVGICGDLDDQPTKPTRMYNYMEIPFVKLAELIADIGKKNIVLEWFVGDVYKACADIAESKDREGKGFPTKYDRVYLSNIPDYTGGTLTIAIFVAPILKSLEHSYISFNILLNTAIFKDLNDCVQRYTMLPVAAHKKYLGLTYVSGALWGEHPKWSGEDLLLPGQRASQDEITTWLYNIFLYMVLPPERSANDSCKVEHPLNLLGFVSLLRRLASIGYPHHWLVAVLDSLLSGKISTTARPPPNSMNRNSIATVSTKPFLPELEYAVSVSKLPFRPLTSTPSSFQQVTYHPNVFDIKDARASVIALFFASPEFAKSSTLRKLRATIMSASPPSVYLLSTLQWDSRNSSMTFWMENSRLKKMAQDNWEVVVVRLDDFSSISTSTPIASIFK